MKQARLQWVIEMKNAALILAKREFVDKIHTRYVIALMLVYALLIVIYSSIIYTDFIDALYNVNIYSVTVIGIPRPVPNAVLLGNMTLFLTLGPLFVISTAFGSLSHEKSTRSLNLLLSYPVSRISILMGKVLGLTLVFVPVVVSLPVILVALSLGSVGLLSTHLALSVVSLELLSILYLLFWLALTILISTVTFQPGDSLAISATIWLLLQSSIFPWLEDAFVLGFVLHAGAAEVTTNPQYFWLNGLVARLVPPYRIVHAIFGSYNNIGLISSSSLVPVNYILNSSITYLQWLSSVYSDVLVLAGSTVMALVASFLIFSRMDLKN